MGRRSDFLRRHHTCPQRRLGLAASAPVYRYLYTHVYDDSFFGAFRADHYLDEPLLWDRPDFLGDYVFSEAEEILSGNMTSYWTNFAKSGDPHGPDLAVWPWFEESAERIANGTGLTSKNNAGSLIPCPPSRHPADPSASQAT